MLFICFTLFFKCIKNDTEFKIYNSEKQQKEYIKY